MSASQKKKTKTGIPVIKITPRIGGGDGVACSHPQTSQSDSHQNRINQTVLVPQSSLSMQPRVTGKKKCPETWADEVIQSQSQKMRNYTLNESRRRREDMEKHIKEVEAQLVTMGNLLEQRDKMIKESAEAALKKTEELEAKINDQESHLIKHGIDPVTGEEIVLDEEGKIKVETSKKFTKKKVQEMRSKLKQMNNQAESYLSEIENTLQFINSLEAASERCGQHSEGDSDADSGEIKKMAETYDKLNESGVTNITKLAPLDKENQIESLSRNSETSGTVNPESHFYDALCKSYDIGEENFDDINEIEVENYTDENNEN